MCCIPLAPQQTPACGNSLSLLCPLSILFKECARTHYPPHFHNEAHIKSKACWVKQGAKQAAITCPFNRAVRGNGWAVTSASSITLSVNSGPTVQLGTWTWEEGNGDPGTASVPRQVPGLADHWCGWPTSSCKSVQWTASSLEHGRRCVHSISRALYQIKKLTKALSDHSITTKRKTVSDGRGLSGALFVKQSKL